MSRTIKILTLDATYRQGRRLLLAFPTIFTSWSRSTSNFYALIAQNLTGEFLWKIYLLIATADNRSLQSFLSSCDAFNSLFSMDVQNEVQLISRFLCYSRLVCLLGFFLRNAPLVKVIGNAISDGVAFVFHLDA